jgi:hypothetical protein
MASRKSQIAARLVRALALRLNIKQTCPLTPVHIPGFENALTDIPLRLFGSVLEWHCHTDKDLLTLFNNKNPLPAQASWTCFQFNTNVTTADEGYYLGRLAATAQNWKTHWANWKT